MKECNTRELVFEACIRIRRSSAGTLDPHEDDDVSELTLPQGDAARLGWNERMESVCELAVLGFCSRRVAPGNRHVEVSRLLGWMIAIKAPLSTVAMRELQPEPHIFVEWMSSDDSDLAGKQDRGRCGNARVV